MHVRFTAESLQASSFRPLEPLVQGHGLPRHRREASFIPYPSVPVNTLADSRLPELISTSRAELRTTLRARRRALSKRQRREWSRRIVRHLAALPAWRAARTIALYHAADGEVDPGALLLLAARQGRTVLLPRLRRHPAFRMEFAPHPPGGPLGRNRFGIAEPLGRVRYPASRIDLVLMPLVGFDDRGNRLGMGSGYYDRRFAFALRRPGLPPRLVGLAYGFQAVPALEARPWDVPLRGIVTERGWIRPSLR